MNKSARQLGYEHGLTAQEMNYILKEKGFLEGKPGEYFLTERGKTYAKEQDFHRGTGGYQHYNRYWTTRSWDEDIINELDLSDELIKEARGVIVLNRQRSDETKEQSAKIEPLSSDLHHLNDCDLEDIMTYDSSIDDDPNVLGYLVLGGMVIAIGYGVFKFSPRVVNWCKTKVSFKSKEE